MPTKPKSKFQTSNKMPIPKKPIMQKGGKKKC